MKFYMLHEARLGTLPEGIKELQCFDENMSVIPHDWGPSVRGRSVILEGTEEDILTWLDMFDGFWKGVGQPFEERFELMSKEDIEVNQLYERKPEMTQRTDNQFRGRDFALNITSELKKQLNEGVEFGKADTQYIEAAYEQLGKGLYLSLTQVNTLLKVKTVKGEPAITRMA